MGRGASSRQGTQKILFIHYCLLLISISLLDTLIVGILIFQHLTLLKYRGPAIDICRFLNRSGQISIFIDTYNMDL